MIYDFTMKAVVESVAKRIATPSERLRYVGWLVAGTHDALPANHKDFIATQINHLYGKVAKNSVGWDFDLQRDAGNVYATSLKGDAAEALRFAAWLLNLTNFENNSGAADKVIDALRGAFVACKTREATAAKQAA